MFLSRKYAKVKALTRRTLLEIWVWPFTWLFQSHYFVSGKKSFNLGQFKATRCVSLAFWTRESLEKVQIHDFRRPSPWQLWLTSCAVPWQLPLSVLVEVYLSFALTIAEAFTVGDYLTCIFNDVSSVVWFVCVHFTMERGPFKQQMFDLVDLLVTTRSVTCKHVMFSNIFKHQRKRSLHTTSQKFQCFFFFTTLYIVDTLMTRNIFPINVEQCSKENISKWLIMFKEGDTEW